MTMKGRIVPGNGCDRRALLGVADEAMTSTNARSTRRSSTAVRQPTAIIDRLSPGTEQRAPPPRLAGLK